MQIFAGIGSARRPVIFFASLSVVMLLMLAALPIFPQRANGRIVGTVTDPGGAVIAGAKVTVTNTGTGVRLDTTTRGDGT
jgi:hypothetical protein